MNQERDRQEKREILKRSAVRCFSFQKMLKIMGKRFLFLLLAMSLCLSGAAVAFAEEASSEDAPSLEGTELQLGDIDADGLVTPVDARLILRISAHLESLQNFRSAQLTAADFDGDGVITGKDARYTLRASLHLDPYAKTVIAEEEQETAHRRLL